ncbi:hypothetical protein ACFYNM_22080 [Streptomyces spororaveus]|uniref:hypothetical protein n=1 Tax=Streptomyces spororaveus TaxID=284039 RepID=UPI00369A71B4
MTTDPDKAQEWLEDWTDVSGVEGLVVKNMNQQYRPGARDRAWTKIRRRNTTEAIIGAVTGTLTRPQLLILGRYDPTGRLRPIGRTVPLRPDAARELAEHLALAGPGHPWTGAKFSSAWGTRDVLDATLVERPTSSRRSAPTPPSTAAASIGIRSGTCACAWTRLSTRCLGSAVARPQRQGDRLRPSPRGKAAVGFLIDHPG